MSIYIYIIIDFQDLPSFVLDLQFNTIVV